MSVEQPGPPRAAIQIRDPAGLHAIPDGSGCLPAGSEDPAASWFPPGLGRPSLTGWMRFSLRTTGDQQTASLMCYFDPSIVTRCVASVLVSLAVASS